MDLRTRVGQRRAPLTWAPRHLCSLFSLSLSTIQNHSVTICLLLDCSRKLQERIDIFSLKLPCIFYPPPLFLFTKLWCLRARLHGCQVTWGQRVQSQPLIAWKLGAAMGLDEGSFGPEFMTTSVDEKMHGIPHGEYGWHWSGLYGFVFWERLLEVCLIKIVAGIWVYNKGWLVSSLKCQGTWGQSMQSEPLRALKLGLATSLGSYVLFQILHGCQHCNTFRRWGLRLVLRVESSKRLDCTLNMSPANVYA